MGDPVVQRDDDVAIIEQKYGDEWRLLTYVGPSRFTTIVDYELLHGGGSIKVTNIEAGYDYIIGENR